MSIYWIALQVFFAKKIVQNIFGWILCIIVFGGIGAMLAWRG
jgi:hypothetical protein